MENEIAVIEQTALTWPDHARSVKIVDQSTYDMAADMLIDISKIEKQIKEYHEPVKTAAFNAHKVAVATEKRYLDPLMEAKKIIKGSISTWTVEQQRIREEAERKARDLARKEEEEARLAKAVEAEESGATPETVEKIMGTPAPVAPVIVQPTFEQNARVKTRETWHAEVTNILDLCQAVIDGKAPMETVEPNMKFLNSMAVNQKDRFSIPGVKAVMETGIVTR